MDNSGFNFQPVIIVGAARSGTNMLRDMLTRMPAVSTWPCDEINYIWRHHNAAVAHDEFSREHARPEVAKYVRRAFAKQVRRDRSQYLIEKTCANSLRVGFVDALIPEAKFIFLVRDGRDVVASALKRWTAKLNPKYLLKKARYVPRADLVYYATRYCGHVAHRWISSEKRLSAWGPRFVGMKEMLASQTLEEVCAEQWSRSVSLANTEFTQIAKSRFIQLRYETLVRHPEIELTRIRSFLGLDVKDWQLREAIGRVSESSIGNWQRQLSAESIERIAPIITPRLTQFGYELAPKQNRRIAA